MTFEDIQALVRMLEHTQVERCQYERQGVSVTLIFDRDRSVTLLAPTTVSYPIDEAKASPTATITATRVGIFHDRHPLSANPLFEVGQTVEVGQHVAFLEAEESVWPVVASASGAISIPQVPNGTVVGFGTVLFVIS
ncbi:MAG TPA: biotin/lipoyl-containing protein [Pseudomonas sp.]|uniref:biotin/lipoyl-containing protein n=1 Tax=Pseudomonas sp. TaxID=306 RepID=UPI002EDA98B4